MKCLTLSVLAVIFFSSGTLLGSDIWVACVNWERDPKPFPVNMGEAIFVDKKNHFEISFPDNNKEKTATTIRLEKDGVDEYGFTQASGEAMGKAFVGVGKVTEKNAAGEPVQFEFIIHKPGDNGKPDKSVRGLYLFIKKLTTIAIRAGEM